MLQQTRVETVIPYYERWLQRFPNIEALAEASIDDVLKQWEGLGYYSRARHLHRTAQVLRERHQGNIPGSRDELKQLPGIGNYTANAVASIAFQQPNAAVDGNVRRVLSRVLDTETEPALLQQYAQTLLDPDRPGDFNQAMMELGATICTPRSPACTTCPVQRLCRAYHHRTVHLRPPPRIHKALPVERVNTLVAVNNDEVLVVQRASRGLLAGLWEFPAIDQTDGFSHVGTVTHTFSHKRIDYHVFTSQARVAIAGRWLPLAELSTLAFSKAQRRVGMLALPVRGS